jgi:AcrR family transcriptional regulator
MNKHQKRTQTKIANVKQAALELFAAHGVDKVSMDEIAAKANVSKKTIYTYFGSKEDLYAEVVNFFIDETLAAIEHVLNSDMDFLEKLKFVLLTQVNAPQVASVSYFSQLLGSDTHVAKNINESLQNRVKALTHKFFAEGQRKGYIDENLSVDVVYLYSEIFQAGFRAKSKDLELVFADNKDMLEKLLNLYFFSVIKKA